MKKKKLTIEPFNESHIAPVLANFRQVDKDEVWASARQTPEEALLSSVSASATYCKSFIWNGEAVAIFGVSARDGFGVPWMLATESIGEWGKEFLPMSVEAANEMLELFPVQHNYIDSRNTTSIKWLRFIGYDVCEHDPTPINGIAFYPFWRIA